MRRLAGGLILALLTTAAYADCAAELAAVAHRHRAAGPFRIESTFMFNNQPRTNVTDVVLPDRVRQQKVGTQSVIVGDVMWLKRSGAWVKAPNRLTPAEREATYFDLADRIARSTDKTCLGAVTREGAGYVGYRFISTHKLGSWDAVWATELFIDRASGLPAIAEVNRGTPIAFTDRYSYDKAISILPP